MNFNTGLITLVIAAVDRHTGYEGYTSGSRDQNLMSRIITTQFCLVHTRNCLACRRRRRIVCNQSLLRTCTTILVVHVANCLSKLYDWEETNPHQKGESREQ